MSSIDPRGPGGSRRRRRLAPEVLALEGRALLSTTPTTTAAVTGPTGLNGYYTGPVTVTLTATEDNAPPSSLTTQYRVNDGPLTTGNQFVVSRNGTDTVQFFTTDGAGNVEPTQTLTIQIDSTAPRLSERANPTTLWPPNHKLVTVTVTGRVGDDVSGIRGSRVRYFVRDEYGQVQPRGTAPVRADGTYSFTVNLLSSRMGQDKDGRHYSIFVIAQNNAGETTTRHATVIVPHDQGHSSLSGGGSRGGNQDDDGGDGGDNGSGGRGPLVVGHLKKPKHGESRGGHGHGHH
jgi:hypothetical protein